MANVANIKKRLEKAKGEREKVQSYVDTAFRYVNPQRRIYLSAEDKHKPNPEIYDSTAVLGVQRFASKMQGMIVPSAQTWIKLKPGSDYDESDAADVDELQKRLDVATKKFFEEIKHSNFDIQVGESFQDLAVTTGALLINPAPLGSRSCVQFKAVPITELFVEKSEDGMIRTVWREHPVRIDEIETLFPGAKVSDKRKEELRKDANATITVVQSVIHNVLTDDYDIDIVDMEDNTKLLETKEEESPFVVFRENVVTGSPYGFGRVLRVLPDIKMVNKVKQLMLQGGSIAISGTFTAHDDGVLNPYNVRLRPGGVIPVNSNDNRNPSVARLDTPTNFDWGMFEVKELQATINDVLLSNPYGTIEDTPVRTAYEIAQRNKDLFESVAPSFGRMQTEFVAPVVRRTIYVMKNSGRIAQDIVLDGKITSYDFISPLTRLQQSADIENVLEWLSIVGSFGEETLQLSVNMKDVPRWLGKQYSVPQELVMTPEQQKETAKTAQELMTPPPEAGAGQQIAPPELGGGVGPSTPGGLIPTF